MIPPWLCCGHKPRCHHWSARAPRSLHGSKTGLRSFERRTLRLGMQPCLFNKAAVGSDVLLRRQQLSCCSCADEPNTGLPSGGELRGPCKSDALRSWKLLFVRRIVHVDIRQHGVLYLAVREAKWACILVVSTQLYRARRLRCT